MSLEEEEVSACSYCGEQPCIWFTYEDVIKDTMTEWCAIQTSTKHCAPTNNLKRKEFYKSYIRMRYGYLGKGQRVEIPACVLAQVRKMYPDEKEEYMGFKGK
jgi:hypothetical protein